MISITSEPTTEPTTAERPRPSADEERVRPSARAKGLRAGLILAAVVFAAVAISSQWSGIDERIADLSAGYVLAACLATVGSLVAAFLSWRATLAGLGDPLPIRRAARVFYVGQLAKYVPGSIWSFVGQIELAKAEGIRRERTATAGVVVLLISLAMGLVLGTLAIPAVLDADEGDYLYLLLLLIPLGVVLHPRVLTALVRKALALLRRPPLEGPLTMSSVLQVAGLSLVNNGLLGVQIWLLARDLGGDEWTLLPLAIGGYGLAAAASLVVIPLPAGAGLREVILVLVLAPSIGTAGATLVALVARLIATLADIAVASVAAFITRR